MNKLLLTIEESLLNHSKPAHVAFQLYELLSESGCDDEYIQEVAAALEDVVS